MGAILQHGPAPHQDRLFKAALNGVHRCSLNERGGGEGEGGRLGRVRQAQTHLLRTPMQPPRWCCEGAISSPLENHQPRLSLNKNIFRPKLSLRLTTIGAVAAGSGRGLGARTRFAGMVRPRASLCFLLLSARCTYLARPNPALS